MIKINAHKQTQENKNDSFSSVINPMNVAEVARALLNSKVTIRPKSNQNTLRKSLNKLKCLYHYYFRISIERNRLHTIDALEQDLMSLINHVREVFSLLSPTVRHRMKIYTTNISLKNLENITT